MRIVAASLGADPDKGFGTDVLRDAIIYWRFLHYPPTKEVKVTGAGAHTGRFLINSQLNSLPVDALTDCPHKISALQHFSRPTAYPDSKSTTRAHGISSSLKKDHSSSISGIASLDFLADNTNPHYIA